MTVEPVSSVPHSTVPETSVFSERVSVEVKTAVTDMSLFMVTVRTLSLMLVTLPPTVRSFVPSVHLEKAKPLLAVAVRSTVDPFT